MSIGSKLGAHLFSSSVCSKWWHYWDSNEAVIGDAYNILKAHKLVDWGVVNLGLNGVPGIDGSLRTNEVESFAYDRLELVSSTSPQLHNVVALATDPSLTLREVRELVSEISIAVGADDVRSMKRWRYAIVVNHLEAPYEDFVYGLIALERIILAWSTCDVVPPLPAIGDDHPKRYSSEENYKIALSALREWTVRELSDLEMLCSIVGIEAIA